MTSDGANRERREDRDQVAGLTSERDQAVGMTSERDEAFVWIWLPGQTEPVVAGRLAPTARGLQFNYGQSYLGRAEAIPIYLPELPLAGGLLPLLPGLNMPSSLRDASPDAWGRRVILNRTVGSSEQVVAPGRDPGGDFDGDFGELTYMLESGSDRIGALDFQTSSARYVPRLSGHATLEELVEATDRVERGVPLTASLGRALKHGTSIGGARPKVLIEDKNRKFIAKFSSNTDLYSVVKAEFLAMRLAALVGLNVAPVQLTRSAGKDALLVERFDRKKTTGGWGRRSMVSALTLLELDEMMARYASYERLAEIIRHRFDDPVNTLRELFSRLVFNVLCGNTDDHARNHSAFWDGQKLQLTSAYDICPQARTGNEATQAMLIRGENRFSRLDVCLSAAPQFQLSEMEAREIIDSQVQGIHDHWDTATEEACLTQVDKTFLWKRQFLNPYAFVTG